MLVQRIITALILASLIALAVFKLSSEYFSLLLGLIALVAAWEWSDLAGISALWKRGLFLGLLVLPMLGIHFWTQILEVIASVFDWTDVRSYSGALEWLVIPPIVFWILVMLVIRKTPAGALQMTVKPVYKMLIGWFVLLAAWMFLSRLRAFYGTEMMMYFLILIWAADVAAYFAGKKWGTVKLSPEISPGKTVQGMYGALASAAVCAIGLNIFLKFAYGADVTYGALQYQTAFDLVLLSVLTVLISIYGDLFFSLAKRQRGVKDSGSLLPGHGGILDRIDSIAAAAPFFYAGVLLIRRAVE
ncbi:MAG: phosphatidate cytidylyltransferase [Methylovulum sp.]|nr:phosphatidate cytidylyltransferase [Methylovulum sp.]